MSARNRSALGGEVKKYLEHRRSLGFGLLTDEAVLRDFIRFADVVGHHGPLTTEFMLRWATRNSEHSPRYQAQRLSIVRSFARHLAARDGKSEVPEQRLLGDRFRRSQPHIYTEKQLRQLIECAATLPSADPLRQVGYATLFGLLASTGMRVSEPLSLRLTDVDLDAGVLRVLETKFRKSRLVPMHPTVTEAMRRYSVARNRELSSRSAIWFFVRSNGCRLRYRAVHRTFRRICSTLGWRGNGDRPLPRIHDLRHSFAIRRLLKWYREGVDVEQAIASLSTYLGHGKVTDTYWYLSGIPALLAAAGGKFERFAVSDGRSP
jgi:site-specific recombinase XerD